MIPIINTMLEDVGLESSPDNPIQLPKFINVEAFNWITKVLKKIAKELTQNKEFPQKVIDRVVKNTPIDSLLGIFPAVNYLGLDAILNAGVAIIKSSPDKAVGFHDLLDDLKKLIIKKLTPQKFMALIQAHPETKSTPTEKNTFEIALKLHFDAQPLSGMTAKEYYESLYKLSGPVPNYKWVNIPGKTYSIGSPTTEEGRGEDENLHDIELSSFSIMKSAVNQSDFARVMGKNPSTFKASEYCPKSFEEIDIKGNLIPACADFPVENVTWDDAQAYARRMSELDPRYIYKLPTEAQFEVAIRGGSNSAYVSGNDQKGIGDYVWHAGNSNNQTNSVYEKLPNNFRVRRSGVNEWTQDWYDSSYADSSGLDPQGPEASKVQGRVVRGGSWYDDEITNFRSAYRSYARPDLPQDGIGFRLVRIVRK